MTDGSHRQRRRYDAAHPFGHVHPLPELWAAHDPTDAMPKLPRYVDDGWLEPYWYGGRSMPPGLLRPGFRSLRSAAAALRRAIVARISTAWACRASASHRGV